jgi:hypothetical protein
MMIRRTLSGELVGFLYTKAIQRVAVQTWFFDLIYKESKTVSVYASNPEPAQRIHALLWKHRRLFIDKGGTVDIEPERMMRIPLIDGWQKTKIPAKMYPLSTRDEKVVATLSKNADRTSSVPKGGCPF